MRRTLARAVEREGIALHAGQAVHMLLSPAEPGCGIVFIRTDLGGKRIPALYDRVCETRLGTVIAEDGATVGVIEHLMAALAGAEIDDAAVSLNGPEPPILDGSSLGYLDMIEEAGTAQSRAPRQAIVVRRTTKIEQGEAGVALEPSPERIFDFEVSFASRAIGQQTFSWNFSPDGFARDIGPARTFGVVQELDALHRAGLGHGASLENTLAIDGDTVVNADKMRFPDEFVRHKILDALGDLALAGAPILARFSGRRSGHTLNNSLLRALFANPANYERVTFE